MHRRLRRLERRQARGPRASSTSRASTSCAGSTSAAALVIGALTTHGEIERSEAVRRRLPILAQAAAEIGGPQIRNRGTIGGNIATGSPAGDTLPVLAVAEATVVLRSVEGERRVPFWPSTPAIAARRRMQPDELLVAVEIPPLVGRQWFRKVGTRAAQAISRWSWRPCGPIPAASPSAASRPPSSACRAPRRRSATPSRRPRRRCAGDHPDRRRALDRELPDAGGREPPRPLLVGHLRAFPFLSESGISATECPYLLAEPGPVPGRKGSPTP